MSGRDRALCRDCQGATTVEFALIGGVVLMLILGIIDLCIMLYNESNLHEVAQIAAREVRIARNDTAATQSTRFQSALCSALTLIDCDAVETDLRRFPDLASVEDLAGITGGGIVDARFDAVSPSDLIFVTLVYRHQFFTPLGTMMASGVPAEPSQHLLVASIFTIAEP